MQNNEIYFSDESFASKREPGLDIALSRALLEQTSLKKYPIILRAYKGTEQIAFGPSDARNIGYSSNESTYYLESLARPHLFYFFFIYTRGTGICVSINPNTKLVIIYV